MFDNTTDHGKGVMVAQFVFLFFACAIFRETSTEMDVKSVNVNKTNRQIFSMVCTLIDHKRTSNMLRLVPFEFEHFCERHFYGR